MKSFEEKYPALSLRKLKKEAGENIEGEEVRFNTGHGRRFLPKRIAKLDPVSQDAWVKRERLRKREYDRKNPEKRRAYREKQKLNPEYIERRRIRSKEQYLKNREKRIAQKTEWCRRNKELYRANWNAWYERVKDTKRGQQLASRIRNRPLYGLTGALRKFEAGLIGIDELTRLYDNAFARVNDAGIRRLQIGKSGSEASMGSGQFVAREANSGSSTTTSQCHEIEIGYCEKPSQDRKGS